MRDMRDFTLERYHELCLFLREQGYSFRTVRSFLSDNREVPERTVILRHDVDRRPGAAKRMALLENKLGISSTYYFRYPYTFVPGIIRSIAGMGHEVGYHYEVLSKTRGDRGTALDLFQTELREFRKIGDVRTACMHGRPLSRFDNRDLWNGVDPAAFGLVGEAYLSLQDIRYFSDTGRSWGLAPNIRDFMPGNRDRVPIDTTNDLMEWIRNERIEKIYLNIHPQRWSGSTLEWVFSWVEDRGVNAAKTGIRVMRSCRR